MDGYLDFEFNLTQALLEKLIEATDSVVAAELSPGNLKGIPNAQGVYQLFLDKKLVYIGKTDSEAGLSQRLNRHFKKILHRKNITPDRVEFKAVRIYVFTAVDLETQLIKHYGGTSRVPWNGSGFGSNDFGRERDSTKYKSNHFDYQFPIDTSLGVNLSVAGTVPAAEALKELKKELPYTFRFESKPRTRNAHVDLLKEVTVSGTNKTAASLLKEIIPQLSPGWQATELPSHIILYKERKTYRFGQVLARS